MHVNVNYTTNRMTEDDYRKYIKFMIDEITDIKNLRELFMTAHAKFINGRISEK